MNVSDFVTDALNTVRGAVAITLDGLSAEQLNLRPASECNSIGWIIWHMARMQDRGISIITGDSQCWVNEGWHARYGMPADPTDTGMGHNSEQVSTFKAPDKETLMDHYDAVLQNTLNYLKNMSETDAEKNIESSLTVTTVGGGLLSIVNGNMQHVGQAGYVRGLIENRRWHPR